MSEIDAHATEVEEVAASANTRVGKHADDNSTTTTTANDKDKSEEQLRQEEDEKAEQREKDAMEVSVERIQSIANAIQSLQSNGYDAEKNVSSYLNQSLLLKQSRQFEETLHITLASELHSLRQECNDIKRKMRTQRLQTVTELNDEMQALDDEATELQGAHCRADVELDDLDTEHYLLEQQLALLEPKSTLAMKILQRRKYVASSDVVSERLQQQLQLEARGQRRQEEQQQLAGGGGKGKKKKPPRVSSLARSSEQELDENDHGSQLPASPILFSPTNKTERQQQQQQQQSAANGNNSAATVTTTVVQQDHVLANDSLFKALTTLPSDADAQAYLFSSTAWKERQQQQRVLLHHQQLLEEQDGQGGKGEKKNKKAATATTIAEQQQTHRRALDNEKSPMRALGRRQIRKLADYM